MLKAWLCYSGPLTEGSGCKGSRCSSGFTLIFHLEAGVLAAKKTGIEGSLVTAELPFGSRASEGQKTEGADGSSFSHSEFSSIDLTKEAPKTLDLKSVNRKHETTAGEPSDISESVLQRVAQGSMLLTGIGLGFTSGSMLKV